MSGSGARVLVVDDERAIQRALKATLEAAGYLTSTSWAHAPITSFLHNPRHLPSGVRGGGIEAARGLGSLVSGQ